MSKQYAYFDSVDPTVYLYSDGRSFEHKDPWDAVLRCQITHMGKRAYLSAVCHKDGMRAFTREGWKSIKDILKKRGVEIAEYHHNGKLITCNIATNKTHCEKCNYIDDSDEITYDDFSQKCKFCRIEN